MHHTKTCETFTSLSTVPFLTWPFSTTLHVPDFIYFLVYLTFFQKSGIQPKFLKQASFDNSTEVHERSTHLAPPGRSQAPATIHEKDSPEHHSLDARYNHASVWTLQWNCQTYFFVPHAMLVMARLTTSQPSGNKMLARKHLSCHKDPPQLPHTLLGLCCSTLLYSTLLSHVKNSVTRKFPIQTSLDYHQFLHLPTPCVKYDIPTLFGLYCKWFVNLHLRSG